MAKHRKVDLVGAGTASGTRVAQKWVVCATSIAVGLGLAGTVGAGIAPAHADTVAVTSWGGFAERPDDDSDDPGIDASDTDADSPAPADRPGRNVLRGGKPARAGDSDDGPRVLINGEAPGGTGDDDEAPDASPSDSTEGGDGGGADLPPFFTPTDRDAVDGPVTTTLFDRIAKLRDRLDTVRKIIGLVGAFGG